MVSILCRGASVALVLFGLAGCGTVAGLAEEVDARATSLAPNPTPQLAAFWQSARADCAAQFAPEAGSGAPLCKGLKARGQALECAAQRLRESGLIAGYTAQKGLLNWEICTSEIARVLVEGYYLGDAEIDRRLRLCEASLDLVPNATPPGVLTRMVKGAAPDEVRPSPLDLGVDRRPVTVGLVKCEVLLPPEPKRLEPPPAVPATVAPPPAPPADVKAEPEKPSPKPSVTKGARKPAKKSSKGAGAAQPATQPDDAQRGNDGMTRLGGKQT